MSEKNTPDDFDWFASQLAEMPADFMPEADCDSVDLQIARNLYYESKGSDLDLSRARLLRVDTVDRPYVLAPMGATSLGYVCQYLNPRNNINDTELALICGTLFFSGDVAFSVTNDKYTWPQEEQAFVLQNYFEGTPNVLLNRSIAVFGSLAVRYTFTDQELEEMIQSQPEYIADTYFAELTMTTENGKLTRRVPNEISLTKPIVQITAHLENGELRVYK